MYLKNIVYSYYFLNKNILNHNKDIQRVLSRDIFYFSKYIFKGQNIFYL